MSQEEWRSDESFVVVMDESVCIVGKNKARLGFQKARNYHHVLEMSGPPDRPHAFPRIVGGNELQPLESSR